MVLVSDEWPWLDETEWSSCRAIRGRGEWPEAGARPGAGRLPLSCCRHPRQPLDPPRPL